MQEEIQERLLGLRLNWSHLYRFVKEVRGIAKDRGGKRYWRYVYEYVPGHFNISLHPWPGLSASSDESAGWISLGAEKGETGWMIYDVRVDRRQYQQRGIGTILVQTAIAYTRKHGGTHLWGWIMQDDALAHPFLPRWYAQLGFMVQNVTGGDAMARIWMDLTPSRSTDQSSSPKEPSPQGIDERAHLW